MLTPQAFNKFLADHATKFGYARYDNAQEQTCYYVNNFTRNLIVYQVNSEKNSVHKLIYNTPLSDNQLSNLKAGFTIALKESDIAEDWIYFLNDVGQKIGERTPQGYVTQYQYDNEGRVMQSTSFHGQAPMLEDFEELLQYYKKSAADDTTYRIAYDISAHRINNLPTCKP